MFDRNDVPFNHTIVQAVRRARKLQSVADVLKFVREVGFHRVTARHVYHALLRQSFEGPLRIAFRRNGEIVFGMKPGHGKAA